nr:hypothetical protein [Bacteroides ovatus]
MQYTHTNTMVAAMQFKIPWAMIFDLVSINKTAHATVIAANI